MYVIRFYNKNIHNMYIYIEHVFFRMCVCVFVCGVAPEGWPVL